jgi:hypothetical protein
LQEDVDILERQSRFEDLVGRLFEFASFASRTPPSPDAPVELDRVREYLHANLREPCPLGDARGEGYLPGSPEDSGAVISFSPFSGGSDFHLIATSPRSASTPPESFRGALPWSSDASL